MGLPLSICIPTFNRAGILPRTLERLAASHAVFSEVVISDNASSDDTEAVVARWRPRFERLRYVRQSSNIGAFRNIYAVQSLASEPYAFVLSDDDALIAPAIADAVALLDGDPECVAVYGGYERWDATLETRQQVLEPPLPGRFTRANKLDATDNGTLLSFPVARSEVLQRHCFFDDTTFGFLRMAAQLIDQGAIRVMPFALYAHAETPERMEGGVTAPTYHDNLRSDYELFAASVEGVNLPMVAKLVIHHTVPVYLLAYYVARSQDAPLRERTYLMRYQASLGASDPSIAALGETWERERLIAATIALLKDRVGATGAARLVVEQGEMNLRAMAAALGPAVLALDGAQWAAFTPAPGDFVLAEYWRGLAHLPRDAAPTAGRLAVADLVASLRLPGSRRQSVLIGRAAAIHVVRDGGPPA